MTVTPDFKFTIVENSASNPNKMQLVYTVDPPRLKSVGTINSLYEMHDLMSKSMQIIAPYKEDTTASDNITYLDDKSIEQSILENGIFFAPDFPDFLTPNNVTPTNYTSAPQVPRNAITWGVVRSEPGTVSGPPFRGTQEIKARFREYISYFGAEGRKYLTSSTATIIQEIADKMAYVKVKAQSFDNLVQYNIWSKSNYEAERLTEWFQAEYMDNFIGMFREAGIVNMYFYSRVRDDTIIQMKNDYHVRSVLYYIRTERVKPEYVGPINQINLNITVKDLQQAIAEGDQSMGFSYDKLVNKWVQLTNSEDRLNGY